MLHQAKRIPIVTVDAVSFTERAYERRLARRTTYVACDLPARQPSYLFAPSAFNAAKSGSQPEPFEEGAPRAPHFSATTLAIGPLGHIAYLNITCELANFASVLRRDELGLRAWYFRS